MRPWLHRNSFMQLPAECAVADNDPLLTSRVFPEDPHPYRSAFQRDRGRIIHSRAFRRLAGKTQVFTHRYSDHFRSRLTHTMEVAQIARTVAAALGLNQDLAESLALVHDIGHPPFGHAGERALDESLKKHGLRFDHNLHALRTVEHFEQRYAAFRGLNLTFALREGIIKHSRDYTSEEHPELAPYVLDKRPPLEAQLIDLVDEIAYLTADLDDGMEAEILHLEDIRRHVRLFDQFYVSMKAAWPDAPEKLVFQETLKRMLNALVDDLISETTRLIQNHGITALEDIRNAPLRVARFSPSMEDLRMEARRYLYSELYHCEELVRDHEEAAHIIQVLFDAWTADPELLPAGYASRVAEEGAPRVVADYIAGMTDNFIFTQYDTFRGTHVVQG